MVANRTFTTISDCPTKNCNEENLLLKDNEYMARKLLPEHHVVFKRATKNGFEGRPINSVFVAIPL